MRFVVGSHLSMEPHHNVNTLSLALPVLSQGFFSAADTLFGYVAKVAALRDSLSPNTLLDCNEMGTILPDDNDAKFVAIPNVYWPASAAMFAYEFGVLSQGSGLNIMGISQLAGMNA